MLVWQDFPCISDKHNMEEANTKDKEVFREDLFTQTMAHEIVSRYLFRTNCLRN